MRAVVFEPPLHVGDGRVRLRGFFSSRAGELDGVRGGQLRLRSPRGRIGGSSLALGLPVGGCDDFGAAGFPDWRA
eukprot:1339039-Pleurochrysis_carterae.AAC.3